MSKETPLINFGDLSKPANILIEKISNAVGVLYEPTRIKKKAEAKAEAKKIKALASIELNDIQHRAIDRMIQQEGRKQENIEAITAQAVASLDEAAEVQNLEEDWVAHFFKNCDTVSDKEMQSLWSRLLSGEASEPGTFSKRTVALIASMDKKDAKIFTNLCQFSWILGDNMPIIIGLNNEIYANEGIDFSVLKHLDAIGLISFSSSSNYNRTKLRKHAQILYFGRPTNIEFHQEIDNNLKVGNVMLTQAGQELAPICGAHKNEKFYNYTIEQWFKQGLITSCPL